MNHRLSSNKVIIDDIIWNLWKMHGIYVKNAKRSMKFASVIVSLLICAATMYLAILTSFSFEGKHKSRIDRSSYMLGHLLPFFNWYYLFRKRNQFSFLIVQIYRLRKLLSISGKKYSFLFPTILFIIILMTIVNSFSYYFSRKSVWNNIALFWTFGFEVKNTFITDVLVVLGVLFSNTLVFYIPGIISVTFSLIEYRCSEVLEAYNNYLKQLLDDNYNRDPQCLIKLFTPIYDITKELKDLLSVPLFLLTSCSFLGWSIGIFIIFTKSEVSLFKTIECVCYFSFSAFILLSQGILASLIPKNILTVTITAGKILEKFKAKPGKNELLFFYLERVEKKKAFYMTACDMFNVNQAFILKAFGAILTYGMLMFTL